MTEEPRRGSESQNAKLDSNLGPETVSLEAIVRALLRAHSDPEGEFANSSQEPWWRQGLTFLVTNWGFTVFIASVLAILVAKALYGFSILYPFQEVAFKEEELQQKKREFEHKREEFNHKESKFKREKKEYTSRIDAAKDQVKLAKSFLDVGQYQEAAQAFDQALKYDRFNMGAKLGRLNSRVYELASSGQYDPEVIEKRLRFILAQNENDPHAHTALGHLYAKFGQPEAARATYDQAIMGDPDVAEAHFGLASLYIDVQHYELAWEPLQEAVKRSPWNRKYVEHLAYLYDKRGDFDNALKHYQRVLILDPDYISPYFEVANLYRVRSELHSARIVQQRLIALLEHDTIPNLPKNKDTILSFQTNSGVSLALDNLPQKKYYAYYSLSITLFLLGDEQQARAYADKAQALNAVGTSSIKQLLAHDLNQVPAKDPVISKRIDDFRDAYL